MTEMMIQDSKIDPVSAAILVHLYDKNRASTTELRQIAGCDQTNQIKYRVREKIDDLTEEIDQGRDDSGRPQPLMIKLSDKGKIQLDNQRVEKLSEYADNEMSVDKQVRRLRRTQNAIKDRLITMNNRVDGLEDRLAELKED